MASVGNDRQRGGQSNPADRDGNRNRAPHRGRTGEPEAGTGTGQKGTDVEGMTRLVKTISGALPLSALPVDLEQSELLDVLSELEHVDLHVFDPTSSTAQSARAHIRYLAALWPDANIAELTTRIHALLNNRNIGFESVMTMLRGEKLSSRGQLSDLRVILRGGKLHNPQATTREVPLPVLQAIGRCLRDGSSIRETARDARCSVDTVRAVDKFLGLRDGYLNRIMDAALAAVREGVSIRNFAAQYGLSKGSAEHHLNKAKAVLAELGEL